MIARGYVIVWNSLRGGGLIVEKQDMTGKMPEGVVWGQDERGVWVEMEIEEDDNRSA